MGSTDRSKKRVQVWKKAAFHFLLCFVMGFFTGFAPTEKPPYTNLASPIPYNESITTPIPYSESFTTPNESLKLSEDRSSYNRTLSETSEISSKDEDKRSISEIDENHKNVNPRRQIIVITPTDDKDPLRGVLLRRMANTLKLVPPPLLWIVVESEMENSEVSEILRRTGVMYRHIVSKENFTDYKAGMDHQRNVALKHIEHHRLSGIVHFAGLTNAYDLNFFEEIRAIEGFGTWPLAKLSTKRKKMIIEGPVCESSQVVGWHLKNSNVETEELALHISSFGFNSSILWDPERWGRLPSVEATKQNSLKFIKKAVIEDESKIKGVPTEDCSKVNIWQLHLSSMIAQIYRIPDSSFHGRPR